MRPVPDAAGPSRSDAELMKALVIFESMYGNTRAVANAVAESLGPNVDVRPVHEAGGIPGDLDLLVVGGPTHMHGLTTAMSRKMAVSAGKEDAAHVEPGATEAPSLREWLRDLDARGCAAAAATSSTARAFSWPTPRARWRTATLILAAALDFARPSNERSATSRSRCACSAPKRSGYSALTKIRSRPRPTAAEGHARAGDLAQRHLLRQRDAEVARFRGVLEEVPQLVRLCANGTQRRDLSERARRGAAGLAPLRRSARRRSSSMTALVRPPGPYDGLA